MSVTQTVVSGAVDTVLFFGVSVVSTICAIFGGRHPPLFCFRRQSESVNDGDPWSVRGSLKVGFVLRSDGGVPLREKPVRPTHLPSIRPLRLLPVDFVKNVKVPFDSLSETLVVYFSSERP